MRIHLLLGLTLAVVLAAPASAQIAPVPFPNEDCYAPAGDPEPGSAEWQERDRRNVICAALRNRDQVASPAFGHAQNTQFPGLHLEALLEQAQDPTNPRGGITTLIPGSRAADPFRTIARWDRAPACGTVTRVTFPAQNGSTLRGYVFEPPASVPKPARRLPRRRDHRRLGAGLPAPLLLGGRGPRLERLRRDDLRRPGPGRLGPRSATTARASAPAFRSSRATTSIRAPRTRSASSSPTRTPRGANVGRRPRSAWPATRSARAPSARSGQCDTRVKAIVAWDNLRAPADCEGITVPEEHLSSSVTRTPAHRDLERLRVLDGAHGHAARLRSRSRAATRPSPTPASTPRRSCSAARRTWSTPTSRSSCRRAGWASGSRRTTRPPGSTAT